MAIFPKSRIEQASDLPDIGWKIYNTGPTPNTPRMGSKKAEMAII
jgi:hypothetical protein